MSSLSLTLFLGGGLRLPHPPKEKASLSQLGHSCAAFAANDEAVHGESKRHQNTIQHPPDGAWVLKATEEKKTKKGKTPHPRCHQNRA
jgi:hypothetical protein